MGIDYSEVDAEAEDDLTPDAGTAGVGAAADDDDEGEAPPAAAPAPPAEKAPGEMTPSEETLYASLTPGLRRQVDIGRMDLVEAVAANAHNREAQARRQAANLNDLRQQQAEQAQKTERRLAQIAAAVGIEDPAAPKPIPTMEEDPAGAIAGQLQQVRQELADLRQQQATAAQDAQLAGTSGQIESYHSDALPSFLATTPDYAEAEAFLADSLTAAVHDYYEAHHPDTPLEVVDQIAAAKVLELAAKAQVEHWQAGTNMWDAIYQTALDAGYTPRQAAAAASRDAAPAAAAPPSRRRATAAAPGAAELARARSRMEQAGVPEVGRAPVQERPLDLRAALDLPDDEFDDLFGDPVSAKQITRAFAKQGN